MATRCPSITVEGKPCQGRVPPGRTYCLSHDPERREAQREASRKGGEAKANARRAAKAWAAFGKELSAEELPDVLKSCMFAVKDGSMTPGQAQAIASLARTSVEIIRSSEQEERIQELEQLISSMPGNAGNMRRIG